MKQFKMTESMKYKVGDKVRIKSLDWYNDNKNKFGNINCGSLLFTSDMSIYCGAVLTICAITEEFSYYHMKKCEYLFTDEMIEGLVEEENALKTQSDNMETETHRGYYTTDPETTSEGKKRCVVYFWDNDFADKVELDLSGRELIQEDGKWFVVKKKKEYPKTYAECCYILRYDINNCIIEGYKSELLNNFQKLLICRDAYWNIAGKEMDLGKPWEPDYDSGVNKYGIVFMNGVVQKSNPTTNWERHLNKILDFPTEEIRDTFYKNFKELIEICKELL